MPTNHSPSSQIPDSINPVVLLQQARAGDQAAWRRFYLMFENVILLSVRRRLSKKLRLRFDSTDVAQMVWQAFVEKVSSGYVLETPAQIQTFVRALVRN